MKLLKDRKIIVLIVILVVFTISYFVIANKISYAFEIADDSEAQYNLIIDNIKNSAIAYGKNNTNLFSENNIIYIKVQDLIDNKFLIPDEDGNLINPLKNSENLNSNVVKIKYENEKFTVEVDS